MFPLPAHSDPMRARRAKLAMLVTRICLFACVLTWISALFIPANSPWIASAFYAPPAIALLTTSYLISRGHETTGAWILTSVVFTIVAAAVFLFGGLSGHNATAFIVAMMVAGTTISGRAAIAVAVAAFVVCAIAALAALGGWLPQPLTPPTPVNALTAMTVSILVSALLLHRALASLQEALRLAEKREAERDEVQKRAVQGQKLEIVGRLSAGIAHDVNNLLTIMRGTSELLRYDARDADMDEELIDDLDAAIRRIALLSGKLLAFSRSRGGEVEVLDLGAVVEELLGLLDRLLGDRVRIVRDLSVGCCFVSASRAAIEQIALNLTLNARDAMPDGGTIVVRVRFDDDRVLLEVKDEGVGMSASTRAQIFEPFFTTKETGTGLGLATVRQIVADLDGTIDVETVESKGSTFRVVLPFVEPMTPMPALKPHSVTRGSRAGHILLVEDDGDVRRSAQRMLEHVGYRVTALTDGREALALVRAQLPFDAIVSDVMMPNVSGDELAAAISQEGLDVGVVLISGQATGEAPYGERVRFLQKPFEPSRLLDALDELGHARH